MKKVLLLQLLLLTVLSLSAKPRNVYMDKELKKGRILKVEVLEVNDGWLKYRNVKNNNINKVRTGGFKDTTETQPDTWTNTTPFKGEIVLIVIRNFSVSLYARKVDEYYRFWSPHFTASVAMFYYNRPALPLPTEKEVDIDYPESPYLYRCWDGCLLAPEDININNSE